MEIGWVKNFKKNFILGMKLVESRQRFLKSFLLNLLSVEHFQFIFHFLSWLLTVWGWLSSFHYFLRLAQLLGLWRIGFGHFLACLAGWIRNCGLRLSLDTGVRNIFSAVPNESIEPFWGLTVSSTIAGGWTPWWVEDFFGWGFSYP